MRLRGRWVPGPVSMGRWGAPVTYAASVWIVAQSINIAWPRKLNSEWYLNWGIVLTTAVLGAIGYVISTRIFRAGGADANRIAEPDAVEGTV
jgi:hypothetical protein